MKFLFSWSHFESALRVSLSVAIICVGLTILILLFSWRVHKNHKASVVRLAVALFSITLLGGLIGFAGGNSRVGVVGDLMPAVLTFMAGAAVYLFGISEKPPRAEMYPVVVAFSLSLFVSFALGASNRGGFQNKNFKRNTCIEIFSQADVLASDTATKNAARLFGDRCGDYVQLDGLKQ